MSQQRNSLDHTFRGRRSLLRRLSYLGGIGVLSGGAAMAQAPSSDIPAVVISTSSTAPAAIAAPPAPVAPLEVPERFEPESAAAPASIEIAPARQSVAPASDRPGDYEAPSAIVFSERSSGCEFSLQQGQSFASTPCASQSVAAPQATAARSFSGSSRSYSSAQVSATSVRVNPAISSSGVQVTQPSIASASGFIKNYYNRSVRPLGLPGNGNVRLLFPLSIPAAITSVFGWRIHPITGEYRLHSGTDLGAPMGTPVLAALTGQVVLADFFGGYGLAIALQHNKGAQQTLYAHLSEIFVKPGEVIKQGTVIGRVGSTGNSTGPHLHFEFRQLTQAGWVAADSGLQLESALAQLVKSLQTAQKAPVPANQRAVLNQTSRSAS